MGWISEVQKFDTMESNFPELLPTWIVIWIADKCDETDIHTNLPKDPGEHRATYSHAQKMRAALSHKFGRDYGLGENAWQQGMSKGEFIGNPSVSVLVGQYMIGLRRRKVC